MVRNCDIIDLFVATVKYIQGLNDLRSVCCHVWLLLPERDVEQLWRVMRSTWFVPGSSCQTAFYLSERRLREAQRLHKKLLQSSSPRRAQLQRTHGIVW